MINEKELPIKKLRNEKNTLEYLTRYCNVNYEAPCDARKTEYAAESIDFISSTATFEHIPVSDLQKIISECHRILKNGGIFSVKIDYRDHWAFFDNTLSYYNFLTFSKKQWKKYNPSLHYQNRLRHIDYIKMINNSGFKLLDEELMGPTEQERLSLCSLKISDEFKEYSMDELEILQSTLVLIKL